MQGELRRPALRWLIQFQQAGNYDPKNWDPKRKLTATGEHGIFWAFYKYAEVHLGNKFPQNPDASGKKLFGELADALDDYYGDHGINDPIIITLDRFQGGLYKPDIQLNSSASVSETTRTKERSDRGAELHTDAEIDPAEIKIFERWDYQKFVRFLTGASRSDNPADNDDLRILMIYFSGGIPDVLRDLLNEKNLRIRILMANEAITLARHALRPHYTGDTALQRLRQQRDDLEALKGQAKRGNLEVLESNVMPCAFVVHSSHGALLGLFLATDSYVGGPMIEVGRNSKLWKQLRADWDQLWTNAERNAVLKEGSST